MHFCGGRRCCCYCRSWRPRPAPRRCVRGGCGPLRPRCHCASRPAAGARDGAPYCDRCCCGGPGAACAPTPPRASACRRRRPDSRRCPPFPRQESPPLAALLQLLLGPAQAPASPQRRVRAARHRLEPAAECGAGAASSGVRPWPCPPPGRGTAAAAEG